MNSSFAGFHFLPPSIHLPLELRPVHGLVAATLPTMIPSPSAAIPQTAVADHLFPLTLSQS